ncbi:rhoptry kinase family protein [Cyclospora cayetanensis]|uniref:Rhoptry kinase family protein n=1 Tax=Cyclospora cayetanensis TaxID=88456 RepID=A0A1D3D8A0_9EIME|nr:rhoptry kinase family protein [Cyclospora cayetanensis]
MWLSRHQAAVFCVTLCYRPLLGVSSKEATPSNVVHGSDKPLGQEVEAPATELPQPSPISLPPEAAPVDRKQLSNGCRSPWALGSAVAGLALWRKTSELYHSPRQALRKAKTPPSWDKYVRDLPALDEAEFPEIQPLLRRLEKKPVSLLSIPGPSARLAAFLGLSDAQKAEGIVDGHALLADFEGFWRNGVPAIMYGDEVETIFTQHYITPELTFDGEYQVFDYKTDVYALGVTFKEMLEWTSDLPLPRREEAEDLVRHMLEPDAEKRYDLKQCVDDPYFSNLDFAQVEQRKFSKAFEGNYITPYKFL